MRNISSLHRIGAACLGSLVLFALTARAGTEAAGPDASGNAGGANGPGAMSPGLTPLQPDAVSLQGHSPGTLPDKQDLDAQKNLKAKFGPPIIGLEDEGGAGVGDAGRTALSPPLTLTPGVPISIEVVELRSRMSANEASASGALKTIVLPSQPPASGNDVGTNLHANANQDTSGSSSPGVGENDAPGIKVAENENPRPTNRSFGSTMNEPDANDSSLPQSPSGGGNEPPDIFVRGAQPVIVVNDMAPPSESPLEEASFVMVAKGPDGGVLPYAEVKVLDESGKTIGAGTADGQGVIKWTPTLAGKFAVLVEKGSESSKPHPRMGIVTLVR